MPGCDTTPMDREQVLAARASRAGSLRRPCSVRRAGALYSAHAVAAAGARLPPSSSGAMSGRRGDHEDQRGEHRERGRRSCRLDGRRHGRLLWCIGTRAGGGATEHRRGSAGDAFGAGLQHHRPAAVGAIRRHSRQYRVLALFDWHRDVDGGDGRTRRHRLRDDAGAFDAHVGGCNRHGECRSAVDPQRLRPQRRCRRRARRARQSPDGIAR